MAVAQPLRKLIFTSWLWRKGMTGTNLLRTCLSRNVRSNGDYYSQEILDAMDHVRGYMLKSKLNAISGGCGLWVGPRISLGIISVFK